MELPDFNNPIVQKTFEFALKVISYAEELESLKKFVLSKQVLRSGTSIGANVREAQMAETKKDFLHKISVAAKEAEETEYWLLLCQHSQGYPAPTNLLMEIREIIKMLNKIVQTTKYNLKSNGH